MKIPFAYLIPISVLSSFQVSNAQDNDTLDEIIVTSIRQDKLIDNVDTNISVINDTDVTKYQFKNIQEIFKYEPGVNFQGNRSIKVDDISIRGIGEDRVKIRLDGVDLPSRYEFGPIRHGRQLFDSANIKQVEIIRGPSSTLHGSNAIGGVVSFTTVDPEDYFTGDKSYGGSFRTGFSSDNLEKNIGLTAASKLSDNVSGLFSYTYRDFSEKKIHKDAIKGTGSSRQQNNPQDNRSHDILTKLTFEPNSNHKFSLAAEYYDLNEETDILSAKGAVSRSRTITNSSASEDSRKRKALKLRHDFSIETPLADGGYWNLYYQKSNSFQNTNAGVTVTRPSRVNAISESYTQYKNDGFGFELQLDKNFDTGKVSHDMVYGLSYKSQKIKTVRERNTKDSAGNQIGRPTLESNFPNSKVKEFGLFIQDTIGFSDGKFELIPGVRYDSYKLNPSVTQPYSNASGGTQPTSFNNSQVSFRLGGLFHINDANTIFASYNQGFRAPAVSDANSGFTNFAGGYTTIANPDLKPESSKGIELGWRSKGRLGNVSMSTFYTKYNNFIDPFGKASFNPATRLLEFQTINLDKTKVYGIEISGQLNLSEAFNLSEGLSLNSSLAYSKGKDEVSGEPIDTIDPLTAVVGIAYDSPSKKWGVEAVTNLVKKKSNSDISSGLLAGGRSGPSSGTPGYVTLDVFGYYNLNKEASINFGITNVFDKKYSTWNSVRGVPDARRDDRYTQPGRNFAVNFQYNF